MPGRPSAIPRDRVRTVSQVNAEARLLVEERFRVVWIEAEVSNFKRYPSGHWYFTLKDDQAQLSCVMFSSRNRFVRHRVGNGASVLVRGRLSIFPPRGQFQGIIDHLEPAGEGALQAAFEQLKAKLDREGLFAAARKRPLPAFPRRIAVISSRNAAALRDVLAVIRRRYPCVQVTCFYVAVQGSEAEWQIIGAFDRAERMRSRPDAIILTRGGGSLEDLAAFNAESVARRIGAARIPVIAAIGHETDFTIADMVADRRTATPSAAAELATPDGAELDARIERLNVQMQRLAFDRLRVDGRVLGAVSKRLVHPGRALEQRMQRTDELAERLANAQRTALARLRTALMHRRSLLIRNSPAQLIAAGHGRVRQSAERLGKAAIARREQARSRLGALARALAAVSPLATLDRGYAILARPDGSRWGSPITSTRQARPGETIVGHLADGQILMDIKED